MDIFWSLERDRRHAMEGLMVLVVAYKYVYMDWPEEGN